MIRLHTAILMGFATALVLQQVGCASIRIASSEEGVRTTDQLAQGRLIDTFADLKPDTQPGKKAVMVMAGTRIPVDVSVTKTGTSFQILLHAHGETFETESYKTDAKFFALTGAAGDQYSPALDLVKFPMHVGEGWNWDGSVSSGGIQRRATASVSTTSANLYNNGVSMEAVKVEVDLSLYSEGTKTPATRKLVFQFVPGKGIVRREFGDASVRELPDQ